MSLHVVEIVGVETLISVSLLVNSLCKRCFHDRLDGVELTLAQVLEQREVLLKTDLVCDRTQRHQNIGVNFKHGLL